MSIYKNRNNHIATTENKCKLFDIKQFKDKKDKDKKPKKKKNFKKIFPFNEYIKFIKNVSLKKD